MGASGDLARKKTYPALFELHRRGLLPNSTDICGFARSSMQDKDLRRSIRPFLQGDCASFLEKCSYKRGKGYGDVLALRHVLRTKAHDNVLIYLAIPPSVFEESMHALKVALDYHPFPGFCRVVLEKPFGIDTESCSALLRMIQDQGWSEESLYRIDHYLGKEVVQNLLTFRTRNSWVSSIWNKQVVQSVHILFKEDFGTAGRGGYFDEVGIIRDVCQNHLIQILTLVAMDTTDVTDSHSLRDAKVQVLQAMSPIEPKDCFFGQYVGYKDDPTLKNKNTKTPTYACLRTWVHNSRWAGVPFVIEAGKALNERLCEVRLNFRNGGSLVLRLQPNPSIHLQTVMKKPGISDKIITVPFGMDYELDDIPEAYTKLILDVLCGNQASFVRDDELLAAWRVFTPLVQKQVNPLLYGQGSHGPRERLQFLQVAGRSRL